MGREFANGLAGEVWCLLRYRTWLKLKRPYFVLTRCVPITAVGAIYASFFWQTPVTPMGSFTVSGLLFVSVSLSGFLAVAPFEDLKNELPKVKTDRRDQYYRSLSYSVEKVLQEVPTNALGALGFTAVAYWAVGLWPAAPAFFFLTLVVFVCTMNATALGFALAIILDQPVLPQAVMTVWHTLNMLCAGFLVPGCQVPPWWRWLYWISYHQWAWSAAMLNEFQHHVYRNPCGSSCAAGPLGGLDIDQLAASLLGDGVAADGTCAFDGEFALEGFGLAGRSKWASLGFAALTFPPAVLAFALGAWRTTSR